MYELIKSIDPSRPVHYEDDREARIADVFSMMYASVDKIVEFAKEENFEKPLVLCEFAHAMGNGPGAIKEYVEAFYKYPRLQGRFGGTGLERSCQFGQSGPGRFVPHS